MIDDSTQERIKNWLYELGQIISRTSESFQKLIDDLEPYQKFEILHPKKKPRGSIRRRKREMKRSIKDNKNDGMQKKKA